LNRQIQVFETEFDIYKKEFLNNDGQKLMAKGKQTFEKIFNSYSKASKRGVKIIVLRSFKMMLRDLQIIPHISTEYKCTQIFKYLESSKETLKEYPEEILTL
jgi:hypothetical protein